jgi:helix-turn-helix protein
MNQSMPRRFLVVLEPISAMIFFSPEAFEEYQSLGHDGWSAYFSSRAAPMGAVSPEVVVATFYNFSPGIVRPNVRWDLASPERMLEARHEGVRRTMHRVFADGEPLKLDRALELLREAVDACPPEGRPLAAAHARLPWPEDPLVGVWHGATVLREFRGDGHIAALLSHGVGPVEAILLHAGYIGGKLGFLKTTRQWDDATIQAAMDRLIERKFMETDGSLTDAGGKFRLMVEHDTDRLAAAPFDALGPEKSEELLALLEPVAIRLLETKAAPKALGRMDPANKLA